MWQVGSACYETEAGAAAAAASSQVGSVVTHGSTAYVVDVSAIDSAGASITYVFAPIDGGTAMQLVAPYSAQPCGLLSYADGLALGWGVGAAWIGAFCLLTLTRAFRHGDA